MVWSLLEIKENFLSGPPALQPLFVPLNPPPPTPYVESDSFSFGNKVSPSILLVIIILAIIFFVSGLLHLLVRFLLRPPNREADELESVTVLQGQLQQLFHLHDSGVDQSFIDTLPVFHYKAIIGLQNPFDCAVCLCEFEYEDKLRLLPKCSHAFHMDCIDTWLLSHSTCPLCRAALLPDFSSNNGCSPMVLVLESGSDSSREMVSDRDGTTSHLGFHNDIELGLSHRKSCEIDANPAAEAMDSGDKVVAVKLGKFRNVDGGGGGGEGSSTTDSNVDSRRCFSMGSFAYVMDENSSLQVPIRASMKKQASKKPLTPGHRQAMSECDCESRREFKFSGVEAIGSLETQGTSSASIGRSKRESFSISKIWLRGKKEKLNIGRASSFRFPVQRSAVAAEEEGKRRNSRTISEMDIGQWENGGNEFGCDQEENISVSCNSLNSQPNPPSFARRSLLWLMGRQQNKVVHSPFDPSV